VADAACDDLQQHFTFFRPTNFHFFDDQRLGGFPSDGCTRFHNAPQSILLLFFLTKIIPELAIRTAGGWFLIVSPKYRNVIFDYTTQLTAVTG
jgi:hypothetical protein